VWYSPLIRWLPKGNQALASSLDEIAARS
jgi:hypothetical protein